MAQQNKEYFSQSSHYKSHKELKEVIYFVIIASIAIWGTVYVQRNYFQDTVTVDPNVLTTEQREQAIGELREVISKSPPITDKQRASAIEELRKTIANQNK
jgi:hypothetical protein